VTDTGDYEEKRGEKKRRQRKDQEKELQGLAEDNLLY